VHENEYTPALDFVLNAPKPCGLATASTSELHSPHAAACSAPDKRASVPEAEGFLRRHDERRLEHYSLEPSLPTRAAEDEAGSRSGDSTRLKAKMAPLAEPLAMIPASARVMIPLSHQSPLLMMSSDSSRLMELSVNTLRLLDSLSALGLHEQLERLSSHDALVRSLAQHTRLHLHRCAEEQRQMQQFVSRMAEVEKLLNSADVHRLDLVLSSVPIPAVPSVSSGSEIADELNAFVAPLCETCETYGHAQATYEQAACAVEQMESLLYSLDHSVRTMAQQLATRAAGEHDDEAHQFTFQTRNAYLVLSNLVETWSPLGSPHRDHLVAKVLSACSKCPGQRLLRS
jgi:hypothetical protein